jgi:hypothetical protein
MGFKLFVNFVYLFNSKMVMYKQILVPDKKNHSIEMPEKFFGKKVEVIVVELADATTDAQPIPPPGKNVAVDELFENFGAAPDFPSAEGY